jgi:hypothetical protein
MPHTTQTDVLYQASPGLENGSETCGFHTVKNAVLALLHSKGKISEEKYKELLVDREFYNKFYNHLKANTPKQTGADISIGAVIDFFQIIKNDKDFDLSGYDDIKEALTSIDFDTDLSMEQTTVDLDFAPGLGISGVDGNLPIAAHLARLARTKGEGTHVFSVGFGKLGGTKIAGIDSRAQQGHWITVVMNQDKDGNRTWKFLDSYYPRRNKNLAQFTEKYFTDRYESILAKDESEVKAYLREVYSNIREQHRLFRETNRMFNPEDYSINEGFIMEFNQFYKGKSMDDFPPAYQPYLEYKENQDGDVGIQIKDMPLNLEQYIIKDKETRKYYVEEIQKFASFIKNADWPSGDPNDTNNLELNELKRLYAIASYINNKSSDDPTVQERLSPICADLEARIQRALALGLEGATIPVEPSAAPATISSAAASSSSASPITAPAAVAATPVAAATAPSAAASSSRARPTTAPLIETEVDASKHFDQVKDFCYTDLGLNHDEIQLYFELKFGEPRADKEFVEHLNKTRKVARHIKIEGQSIADLILEKAPGLSNQLSVLDNAMSDEGRFRVDLISKLQQLQENLASPGSGTKVSAKTEQIVASLQLIESRLKGEPYTDEISNEEAIEEIKRITSEPTRKHSFWSEPKSFMGIKEFLTELRNSDETPEASQSCTL